MKHVTNVHARNITTVTMNQTPEEKDNKNHRKIETHIKPNFKKQNNDKADCLTVTISIQTSWT